MTNIPLRNVLGMNDLPSLKALRFFEAAARHLSFTHAAVELGVGQPAVSRQVTNLEAELGVILLVRRPAVKLTDHGRRLYEATTAAFESISEAATDLRRPDHNYELTIDVSIGFASCWLLQRLADFSSRHPEIAVRLMTRDLTEVANPDADVSIFYAAEGRIPGADLVFADDIVPAVAAGYPVAERPRTLDALAAAPLLGMSERVYGDAWNRLFRVAGGAAPMIAPERRFTSFIVYREALLRGRGVGLAWRGLMDGDFDSGLIEPVTDVRLQTDSFGYWMTSSSAGRGVEAFRHWLLDMAGGAR